MEGTQAIVTGASSGIGRATAIALAARGADIGITYAQAIDGAEETAATIAAMGRRAFVRRLDLTEPSNAESAIDELSSRLGGVDVLVNNAGANRRRALLHEDLDGWNAMLSVHVIGPWACARAAAIRMIDQGRGGRIVNITSVLAHGALAGAGAYAAAKSGLDGLTRALAAELAEFGILVNAVAAGHTATPMNVSASELEGVVARPVIPLRRAAGAREIAGVVAMLASPDASYVTGSSVLVDGGLMLQSGPQELERALGGLAGGPER